MLTSDHLDHVHWCFIDDFIFAPKILQLLFKDGVLDLTLIFLDFISLLFHNHVWLVHIVNWINKHLTPFLCYLYNVFMCRRIRMFIKPIYVIQTLKFFIGIMNSSIHQSWCLMLQHKGVDIIRNLQINDNFLKN
jgi:hypothetical protein